MTRAEWLLPGWNALVFTGWATVPFLVAGIGWRRGRLHVVAVERVVLAVACVDRAHRLARGAKGRIGDAALDVGAPFFEGVVRIQHEVGHRTIDDGPYRWIRHPGYAGLCAWALGTPLLLGRSRAVIPALRHRRR